MTAVTYKLTLDYPINFSTENGLIRTQRSTDFRLTPGAAQNTWLDPVSGVLMLQPNTFDRSYRDAMVPLSEFDTTPAAGWWRDVQRAQQDVADHPANMFSSVWPAGQGMRLIELAITTALIAVLAAVDRYDDLVWVAQSKFSLGADEGHVLHYQGVNDEILRHNNWFAVQWDNIYCHFSMTGKCRVFQYGDRTNPTGGAQTPVDEFDFADAGEMMGRHGQIMFLPIPSVGLLIYHSFVERASASLSTNAHASAVRGHLVKWPTTARPDGMPGMFQSSPWRLALNPYQRHVWGFQKLVFPGSGTFTDDLFSIGYVPSLAPSALTVVTASGSASGTLVQADGITAWTPDSTSQARMQMTLTGGQSVTPFVIGYGVQFPAKLITRGTTPLVLSTVTGPGLSDKLQRLEWTDDELGQFEGVATMQLRSAAARWIAERGDATFRLDYSLDGGLTWFDPPLALGFAKHWELTPVCDPSGYFYLAECQLMDVKERLREGHYWLQNAMDGISVADALNDVWQGSGFLPAPNGNFPAIALNTLIPTTDDGRTWRFAFNEADDPVDIERDLLFLLRYDGGEYISVYDDHNNTWLIKPKPHDLAGAWTITPFKKDRNPATLTWYYGPGAKFCPEPPEGNEFITEGVLDPSPHGVRVPCIPIANADSISNAASADYLGRKVTVKIPIPGVEDQGTLNLINLSVYLAARHRRVKGTIIIPSVRPELAPNVALNFQDGFGNVLFTFWIKRRHVVTDDPVDGSMTLEVDTVWAGEVTQ